MNNDQEQYLQKLEQLKAQMSDISEIINRIEERMKSERIQTESSGEETPKQD